MYGLWLWAAFVILFPTHATSRQRATLLRAKRLERCPRRGATSGTMLVALAAFEWSDANDRLDLQLGQRSASFEYCVSECGHGEMPDVKSRPTCGFASLHSIMNWELAGRSTTDLWAWLVRTRV